MNDELNGLKSTATGVAAASVAAAAADLRTLINTLCPEGVEWKALGDIFVMRNGYTPSKSEPSFWEDGTIPWFRMEDIRNNGNILTDSIQHVTPAAVKGKLFPAGSIILATTATIGIHALLTSDSLANQQFTFFTKRELPGCDIDMKFMFYYFFIVDEWCKKHIKVSSFPAVDVPALAKLKVPVPPLAVQEKIVQILDKFTELAKELAKEKQARRAQYEYYRDWLLDLAHPEGKQGKVWDLLRTLCPNGVEWKTLGDIASISRGGSLQRKDFRPSGVPCIHYGQIYTSYNNLTTDHTISFIDEACAARQRFANKNDLIMTVTSENVRDVCKCIVWLGQERVAVSAHTVIIQHDQNSKYLAYYFSSVWFFMQKRSLAYGTKVIDVSLNALSKVRIPIPPLPVQAEIVRILDQFSTLAEDITTGLPAEIAARQTQYEYYRNQLLSFKDVSDRAPGC